MTSVGLRRIALASFVFFVSLVDSEFSSHEVEVGDHAVITCDKTCGGNLTWSYHSKDFSAILPVLTCVQRSCTAGESYKNRVKLSDEKTGKSSVILNPVYFNDDGTYEAKCDSEHLCEVRLVVLVPQPKNATVGETVVLPCYAHTDKQSRDDEVNILWKKDDQSILNMTNGKTDIVRRGSVQLDKYKEGDLSLTILHATMSDKGLYSCYHRKQQDLGTPDSFHLNVQARRDSFSRSSGSSLTLQLFGLISGTINFQPSADPAKEIQVCEVTGTSFSCSSHFSDRASVTNDTFVLRELTSQDSGTYTVKDQNETVGVYSVIVKETGKRGYYFWIPLSIFALVGILALCYMCYKRQRRPADSGGISYDREDDRVNGVLPGPTSDQTSEPMLSIQEETQINPKSSVVLTTPTQ